MQIDLLLDSSFIAGLQQTRGGKGRESGCGVGRGGKVLVTPGERGVGWEKTRREKSRETSPECNCVLRCKWRDTDTKAICSLPDSYLKTGDWGDHSCSHFLHPTILHSACPTPRCDSLGEFIPDFFRPAMDPLSSFGTAKCLHIISAPQHEWSQYQGGGGSICVCNSPLFQVITHSYTGQWTRLLLMSWMLPPAKAKESLSYWLFVITLHQQAFLRISGGPAAAGP